MQDIPYDDLLTTTPGVDLESDAWCFDCGGKVEWYWVHNKLWNSVIPQRDRKEWICVRCFSRRLGRPMTPDDLNEFYRQVPALIERISIPYGYCYCNCGEKTNLARATIRGCGWIKGQPLRYVMNHHRRKTTGSEYRIEDHGYDTPCWIWQGVKEDGYGRINREGFRRAHTLYYVKAKGPIPDGMQLDHLCRARACVNPDHLEPVTQTVNVRRGVEARGKPTHCKHGHEFTPENTIVRRDGSWRCRMCDNATQRAHWHRKKAQREAER
jgi:hypothetical protein